MTGTVAVYTAWAPAVEYDALRKAMRERYARGDLIPQRQAMLGVYGTAAEAMERCKQHASGVRDAG